MRLRIKKKYKGIPSSRPYTVEEIKAEMPPGIRAMMDAYQQGGDEALAALDTKQYRDADIAFCTAQFRKKA